MRVRYNPFHGRINRATFVTGFAFIFIAIFVLKYYLNLDINQPLIYLLIRIFLDIFLVSILSKRLHDLGHSGWASLALIVVMFILEFVGNLFTTIFIITLYIPFIFTEGSKTNSYGAVPLPLINIFSLLGFYTENNPSATLQTTSKQNVAEHQSETIIRKILDIIEYKQDKNTFMYQFFLSCYKDVSAKLAQTISEDDKAVMLDEVSKATTLEGLHNIITRYILQETYENTISETIQQHVSAYIHELYPTLSVEKKRQLDEYLKTL